MKDRHVKTDLLVSEHVHDCWDYLWVPLKVAQCIDMTRPAGADDLEELRFVTGVICFQEGQLVLNQFYVDIVAELSDEFIVLVESFVDVLD
jgi:hypothetical protein